MKHSTIESIVVTITAVGILALLGCCAYLEHFKSKVEEQAKWCAGQGYILTIGADDKRTCVKADALIPWRPQS